jgi:monoamine oxidase
MDDVDIVVIGAGAAGLAAARRAAALGRPVRVLESRARLGGRAFTSYDSPGQPIELGCGWMHSADENEFADLAAKRGFTIDKTRPPWRTQLNDIGFPPVDQDDFRAAAVQFFDRLDAAGEIDPDQAAYLLLEPGGRWNALINAASTYINGVELDGVSAHDFYRYRDTGVNWRVREGYGTLIAALGQGLDITRDCPATLIDHAGAQLRIETPHGDLRARTAIITIPTNVLCAGALRFQPALPDKLDAAAVLPLGLADKLYLRLDEAEEFPKDSHLYGAIDRVGTGSYHLRPFGHPLIECYFGGRLARDLEAGGEAAFAAFALDELASLLGGAIRKRLHPIAASAWARDHDARGSYSHALPGHADARRTLAAPVDGRLFFAGEACSVHDFSTAHGAYRTGIAAADAAINAIERTGCAFK